MRFPLSVKLWGVFAGLTLLVFGLLAAMLPGLLKSFFTEQVYDLLVDAQMNMELRIVEQAPVSAVRTELPRQSDAAGTASADGDAAEREAERAADRTNAGFSGVFVMGTGDGAAAGIEDVETDGSIIFDRSAPIDTIRLQEGRIEAVDANGLRIRFSNPEEMMRTFANGPVYSAALQQQVNGPALIQHFVLNEDDSRLTVDPSTAQPVIAAINRSAAAQEAPIGRYSTTVDNRQLLYVIRKQSIEGEPSYLVSYAWGNYRNSLVQGMYGRLLLLMVGLLLFSWPLCLLLARRLTRPLVMMERHVGRLAEREWDEPLETNRRDEIGRLGRAIEAMRQRLVRQDRAQQFYLQNLSHGLKTPVMVIRSYAESVRDGIYPAGGLQRSVEVISAEAERLERRIGDLLLLNRLQFLTARKQDTGAFPVRPLIAEIADRLLLRRPDLTIDLLVPDSAVLIGDREQWRIVFENLFDNQLRYARTRITVSAEKCPQTGKDVIRIVNDGPPLGADPERLFEPFETGEGGQYGLGLAIVRQVAGHYGMRVSAADDAEGVTFRIAPEAAA